MAHRRFAVASVVLIAVAFISRPLRAQSYTFTTFAGTTGGQGISDGMGTGARLSSPWGVAVDANGNVFVADYFNHTFRRIAPDGTVTTLAGMADQSANVDGRRFEARLHYPSGPAIDPAGNIYFADYEHTIRKVTPAGVVSTIAGKAGIPGAVDGPASTARFYFPYAVAVDAAGTLYVADRNNHTIRRIAAGNVDTIAGVAGLPGSSDGTTATRFRNPEDVALDGSGNLYVADSGNHTIRRIALASGTVTTLAGLAGSFGSADGDGSAARFNSPSAIALDGAGNLIVADTSNHTIRRVTPAGRVTTIAGIPRQFGTMDGNVSAALLWNPQDVAIDPSGNIYVASAQTIRKITPAGMVSTVAGMAAEFGSTDASTPLAARFDLPRQMAFDTAGSLYIADSSNSTIRKITSAGLVSTFAGTAGQIGTADGNGSAARFRFPFGVAVDAAGNVFVADTVNKTIRKITPQRDVSTYAGIANTAGSVDGPRASATFNSPQNLAVDAAGNVYVSDHGNHTIRKITPGANGSVSTLAGAAGVRGSADGSGNQAQFDGPAGLVINAAGDLFVADEFNDTIRRITPAGLVTTFAGVAGAYGDVDGTGTAARLNMPNSLALDAAGNLFVGQRNGVIRKITPAAVVTTIAGDPLHHGSQAGTGAGARFTELWGIAVDSSGAVLVADTHNECIRKGTPAIADVAQIDAATGPVNVTRQLSVSTGVSSFWSWSIVRRPAGSIAQLSSTTVRSPTFTPDIPDLYVFRLRATSRAGISFSDVEFTASCPSITVAPNTLANGVVGSSYNMSITAAATNDATFDVASGTLPPGLTLQKTAALTASLTGLPTTAGQYTFTIRATDAFGCSGSRSWTITIFAIQAPGRLTATATSASSVSLTWNAVLEASSYDVLRTADIAVPFSIVGTAATPSFIDTTVSANRSYLYVVRAVTGNGGRSADSNRDFATTIMFAETLTARVSSIKASHFMELRSAVNAGRVLARLSVTPFTDPALTGVVIKSVHLTELRTAVTEIRTALQLPPFVFADSIVPGSTAVKAAHILELRSALQ